MSNILNLNQRYLTIKKRIFFVKKVTEYSAITIKHYYFTVNIFLTSASFTKGESIHKESVASLQLPTNRLAPLSNPPSPPPSAY